MIFERFQQADATITRRLRSGEAGDLARDVPVLMLTANTLPTHVAQAHAAGADGHLPKPIIPAGLLNAISDVMSQADRRQPCAVAAEA